MKRAVLAGMICLATSVSIAQETHPPTAADMEACLTQARQSGSNAAEMIRRNQALTKRISDLQRQISDLQTQIKTAAK